MPPFTHHIFVCCNRREPGHSRGCCDPDGRQALRDCFKAELKKRRLSASVRANQAGCLDQCELGPTVVIYPQGIWYGHVQPADVPRIIDETIVSGRILADLLIADDWLNTAGRGPDPSRGQPEAGGGKPSEKT
ncbi:MAG TPA: (2Fe-2S) ferredoxin domain-containing protein [Pirellulales bacterium]